MAYFGIDLGTTTTLIARGELTAHHNYKGTELQIPQKDKIGADIKSKLLPSFAYFPDGQVIVGTQAKEMGVLAGIEKCVRAVKRLMGRDVPPFTFNNKQYNPSDIAAIFLEHIFNQVILKENDEEHVITVTVPASFTTRQRRDTIKAIEKALSVTGVKRRSTHASSFLISEPLAALISYISEDIDTGTNKINIDKHPIIMVYDIGGGTLDLTLVELGWKDKNDEKNISNVNFKVIDVNRYTQVGGEDFDEELAKWLHQQLLKTYPELKDVVLSENHQQIVKYTLIHEAERLKRQFNEDYSNGEDETNMCIKVPVKDDQYECDIHIDEKIIKNVYKQFLGSNSSPKNCLNPISAFFERTGKTCNTVDYFLCVGGMSRFIFLREAITHFVKEKGKILFHMNSAEYAVSKGAAIYSMMKDLDAVFIDEPASDAYYIKTIDAFRKILGRKDGQKTKITQFNKDTSSQYVDLFVFAGEDTINDVADAGVLPTLLYQGGERIDLGQVYSEGTDVLVSIHYEGDDKAPYVIVTVDNNEVYNGILSDKQRKI